MTGVLYDLDVGLGRLIPRPGLDEIRAGLAQASDRLLAAGITSVDDASVNSGADEVTMLRDAVEEGVVRQRVRCLWGLERHGFPHDPTINAVKLALDEEGGDAREFGRALEAAHRGGLQVAVHAVEGPAIAVAVEAFESTLSRWPRPHRHRVEHCALCPPPLAKRIAELGLAVVTQPGFVHYAGDRYLAEVPVSEQNWLYPLKSLGAEGVVVAGSSDAPVGPLAPLRGVAAAVCRRTAKGQLVAPDEAIKLEAALQLYGRGAAWATQADDGRGCLATGHVADLVVLRQDLTRVPVAELGGVPVAFAVIDGQMTVPRDLGPRWRNASDRVARAHHSAGRKSSGHE
jgi:predicted amidohydrolase YtcJ